MAIPDIGDAELSNLIACVTSGWLTTGKRNFEFESLLEEYLGAQEVICTDSCTSALHLSLVVSGIGNGDEVITTPFTFAATANVIEHCGAQPVFCDIDPQTYNIDCAQIEKKITRRTKAILPVHFAGYPCNLARIYTLSRKHGLRVIEDAAHAMGSCIGEKKIGSFPGLTCFSFYATKNITTGEGGCVALANSGRARAIRTLRFHGINKDAWKRYTPGSPWKYDIVRAGYKNNMTDIVAAIGIAQIKRIEQFHRIRRVIVEAYNEGLKECPGLVTPMVEPGVRHSWHLYVCRIKRRLFGMSRNQFIETMAANNIGTGVHYWPLHLHSYYRKKYGLRRGDFPHAERAGDEVVSLPLYTTMTEDEISKVIHTVKDIQQRR